MKRILSVVFALAFYAAGAFAAYTADTDPVMKAMTDEMDRSFPVLNHAEQDPLYYLAYEITDEQNFSLNAQNGDLAMSRMDRSRYLDVEERVGSRQLDNTHEVKGMQSYTYRGNPISIPVDGDTDSIKAIIWRWTDYYFKRAQENYLKVKTNKAMTAQEDDKADDFSQEDKPEVYYETVEFPEFDKTEWETRAKAYSSYLASFSFVFENSVYLSVDAQNRYFVSSEGTRVKSGNVYIYLAYRITSRTDDGMDLERARTYSGVSMKDLPSDKEIRADMEQSVKELQALRNAPVVEPYSGPAILKSRAAGVYFHEIFGHRMEGHRQKRSDSGQTFAKKVNEKIVSDTLTIEDDPTLAEYNGIPLRGYYKYDDEGVKAQKVTLVENGVLRNFLMSRSPAAGFTKSNGHGRRSPGLPAVSRMGNTIVTVKDPVSFKKLRDILIKECKKQGKPYGLVFDDISGGFTMIGRGGPQSFTVKPLLVYRVYADGRPDEVVRGVNIVGTPLTSFNKVSAGADDTGVFNGTCGAESGWVPVSAVSPSILITEVEVEKTANPKQKPPLLPPPDKEGTETGGDK
ncbi:MAG: metallopeptidase TldD-related protein [Elusimicrobiaceae bacterium]